MGNMAYARFRNTLRDLRDCYEHMDEEVGEEEKTARERLIHLCDEIAQNYAFELR